MHWGSGGGVAGASIRDVGHGIRAYDIVVFVFYLCPVNWNGRWVRDGMFSRFYFVVWLGSCVAASTRFRSALKKWDAFDLMLPRPAGNIRREWTVLSILNVRLASDVSVYQYAPLLFCAVFVSNTVA